MEINGSIDNTSNIQADLTGNDVYSVDTTIESQELTGTISSTGTVTGQISSTTISGDVNTKIRSTDSDDYVDSELLSIYLSTKVDKVDGKGLSSNDFTDYYKTKIDSLSSATQSDWAETDTTSIAYILNKPDIYTKTETDDAITSALTSYATKDYVSTSLVNYTTRDYVTSLLSSYATTQYVDTTVDNAVKNLSTLKIAFVSELPDTSDASEDIIYLIADMGENRCKSFVFNSDLFWELGNADVDLSDIDLSNYYTKDEADELLSNKSDLDHSHDDKYLSLKGGTVSGDIKIISEDESITISAWGIDGNKNATINGFNTISSDTLTATDLKTDTVSTEVLNATEIYEGEESLKSKYVLRSELGSLEEVDLSNYYTKDEVYSKAEIDEMIGDVASVLSKVVAGCDIEAILATVVEGTDETKDEETDNESDS